MCRAAVKAPFLKKKKPERTNPRTPPRPPKNIYEQVQLKKPKKLIQFNVQFHLAGSVPPPLYQLAAPRRHWWQRSTTQCSMEGRKEKDHLMQPDAKQKTTTVGPGISHVDRTLNIMCVPGDSIALREQQRQQSNAHTYFQRNFSSGVQIVMTLASCRAWWIGNERKWKKKN